MELDRLMEYPVAARLLTCGASSFGSNEWVAVTRYGLPECDCRARNKATYTYCGKRPWHLSSKMRATNRKLLRCASNFHFYGVISTTENYKGHEDCCCRRVIFLSAEERSSRGESGLAVVFENRQRDSVQATGEGWRCESSCSACCHRRVR
jgi:hypothetical protein